MVGVNVLPNNGLYTPSILLLRERLDLDGPRKTLSRLLNRPVFTGGNKSSYHTTLILHTISLCNVGGTEQITDFMSYKKTKRVSPPVFLAHQTVLMQTSSSRGIVPYTFIHTSCFTYLSLFDKDKPRCPSAKSISKRVPITCLHYVRSINNKNNKTQLQQFKNSETQKEKRKPLKQF